MENLEELFFGKEFAIRNSKFKAGLQEIEKNHINYFKEREAKNELEKHDKLANHYIIVNDHQKIRLRFLDESDLKLEIRKEVIDLFNQVWK